MTPEATNEDVLSHIDYQEKIDPDNPELLRNKASAVDGSITIISAFGCSLVLSWSLGASDVQVTVTLKTPVGSVTIINAKLDAAKPTIKLGGSINSFKAEAEVSFDFSTLELTASGQICAPILGCKKGSVHVKL